MLHPPLDLSKARILVSNDDGIHAPGIKVLERIARSLSSDVWICAPESEQSGASHSLTITRPLRLIEYGEQRYAVDGTPTDSVLMAVNLLMKDHRPDLILSGVNRGANLGEDVTYSGTIAAAMEGTLLDIPSIALSSAFRGDEPKWDTVEQWAPRVLEGLVRLDWPKGVLINVNFPDVDPGAVTGIEVVQHGKRKIGDEIVHGMDPRNRPYYWIGTMRGGVDTRDNTDVAVIERSGISVTPLHLDLTHHEMLEPLRHAFRPS